MSTDQLVGYLTVRVPVYAVTDSESWEIPEEYTYLSPGDAELVSHDIPDSWHEALSHDKQDFDISLGEWSEDDIAAKCTNAPEAAPAAAETSGLVASPAKGIPA